MNPNNEPHRVELETDSYQAVKYYREPNTPGVVRWVIKYSGGLVKDGNQASYVLIGFVVVAIIISLFLIFGGSGTPASKIPLSPFESP